MLGLGLGIWLPALGGAFSPATLFAASEPGAWLDPSDLSTLYQNTAGPTPVTAPGKSVGLVLDKSQGLVLGPELVTNGDFSDGSNSWASGSSFTSTATVEDGEIQVTPTVDFGRQLQALTLVVGRTYQIEGNIRRISGALTNGAYVSVGFGSQGDTVVIAGSSSATQTSFKAVFVPTNATVNINLAARTGNVGGFDNISVRELPGYHAKQATAAARPLYQISGTGAGYLYDDLVDDALNWTAPAGNYTVAFCDTLGNVTIQTAQALTGATDALKAQNMVGYVAIGRALTAAETASLTAWFKAKAGV